VADDAGALLVRSGLVTANALDDARARVASIGGTLGEQLVTSGAIGDDALTDFYRARLLVPQVNPNTLARLTPTVVAAIPGDMAIELRAIPVSLDGDNTLTIAMSDPSDRHAVDEIAFFTGAYVVRAIATQMQIAWCLAHYYGHVTLLGQRLLSSAQPPERPARPTQASSTRPPRAKGLTGKVNAARHRAVAPVTGPLDAARPRSDQLDGRSPDAGRPPSPSNAAPNGAQHHTAPSQVGPSAPATTTSTRTLLPGTPAASSLSALRIDMEEPDLPAPTFDVGGDDDDAGDIDIAMDPPPDDSAHRLSQATERAIIGHGPPDRPRARSISGEIRAPIRRAPSIRPPLPGADEDDDDEPVIVISRTDVEPGATRKLPPRRRIVKSDPPELKARAGEVDLKSGGDRAIDADEPRIVIDQEALTTTSESPTESAHEHPTAPIERRARPRNDGAPFAPVDHDSTPILLDRPRGTPEPFASALEPEDPDDPGPRDDDDDHDDDTPESIVVLDARKPRSARHTQVGIAPVRVPPRPRRDTETSAPAMDARTRGDRRRGIDGPTAIDLRPAPPGDDATFDELAAPPAPSREDDTNPYMLAPPPAPPVQLRSLRKIDYDAIDDGWGPPGTTIPPPLLGAIPGSEDDDEPGAIPMPSVDSSPLVVASTIVDPGSNALARALDEATGRALDVIRRLEHAETRDQVVETMLAHLGETHQRAGFFVTRHATTKASVELSLFAMRPRPAVTPYATLRLDRPSTLQDVVGTRLPYRGPMHDDASRTFLIAVLGACPPEILLVPVAVRERVVGVLFGEHRQRHTFDDQFALAARAAGMALERILRARRT